jgi:hypothetical protein
MGSKMGFKHNTILGVLKSDGTEMFHEGIAAEISKITSEMTALVFNKIRKKNGLNVDGNNYVIFQLTRLALMKGFKSNPLREGFVKIVAKDVSKKAITNARNKLRNMASRGTIDSDEYPITMKNKFGNDVIKTCKHISDEESLKAGCLKDIQRVRSMHAGMARKWQGMRGAGFAEWASTVTEATATEPKPETPQTGGNASGSSRASAGPSLYSRYNAKKSLFGETTGSRKDPKGPKKSKSTKASKKRR